MPEPSSEKKYVVTFDEEQFNLLLLTEDERHVRAVVDGQKYQAELARINPGHLLLRMDGKNYEVYLESLQDAVSIQINGKPATFRLLDARALQLQELAKVRDNTRSGEVIKAPMPGLILRILASEGQEVKANDGLLVIEAMKMENEIRASTHGVIRKIFANEGEAVEKGALLMEIA